ncbi:hypothetical protein V5739_03510 [Salinimicrobium sp. TIG7-5_MAKvit]|uniref:hypothetical protein n=1 Tax=Salinimicrobium sp. TIG7-5_MAKvit TaxID=3121289 RepID=UPI003C6E4639
MQKTNESKYYVMKLASFNTQNLFFRHKELLNRSKTHNFANWLQEMDELMIKFRKTGYDLDRLRDLSFLVGFEHIDQSGYVVMRRKGGNYYIKGVRFSKEMHAAPYNNWNGWIEVENHPLSTVQTENKARVVSAINPDLLILQEVESCEALRLFNKTLLPQFQCFPFYNYLFISGNTNIGQDMALLTRTGYTMGSSRSHHSVPGENNEPLFERNLLEYEVFSPAGERITIISAHLTEDNFKKEESDRKRAEQALYIASQYERLLTEGQQNVVVCGTLNAPSYCYSLSSLLRDTSLQEISRHPRFSVVADQGKDSGYYSLGAYGKGINLKQKDYLLLSPALFKRILSAGMSRRGVWPQRMAQWPIFPQIRCVEDAASEHPALWVELDI